MLNDVIMAVKDATENDLMVRFWFGRCSLHIWFNFVVKVDAVGLSGGWLMLYLWQIEKKFSSVSSSNTRLGI